MEERKKELLALCDDKNEVSRLVDEIVFIESKLAEIKILPFYKVHPDDPLRQKVLPVGKLYKELLQQYNSCLKLFASMTGHDMEDEESPLRKWVKERSERVANKDKSLEYIKRGEGLPSSVNESDAGVYRG